MCRNSHFGVLNIIFLQILQLPSVKRNQPSVPISFLESQQRIGASGTLDVWKTFQYDELTINMRQRNDKTYTDILSRLCVGHTTTGDCSVLREKLITKNLQLQKYKMCNRYLKLADSGKSPLVLLWTTTLCKEIHSALLDIFGSWRCSVSYKCDYSVCRRWRNAYNSAKVNFSQLSTPQTSLVKRTVNG